MTRALGNRVNTGRSGAQLHVFKPGRVYARHLVTRDGASKRLACSHIMVPGLWGSRPACASAGTHESSTDTLRGQTSALESVRVRTFGQGHPLARGYGAQGLLTLPATARGATPGRRGILQGVGQVLS